MDLIVWLASFGKVRKDELLGFFELAVPQNEDVLVDELANLIQNETIRVGSYQKLSLNNPDQSFSLVRVVNQVARFGVPPYQLVAFLRNQGIDDTYDFMYTISTMLSDDQLRTNGAGILTLVPFEEKPSYGGYVGGPDYTRMRQQLTLRTAQGVQ